MKILSWTLSTFSTQGLHIDPQIQQVPERPEVGSTLLCGCCVGPGVGGGCGAPEGISAALISW